MKQEARELGDICDIVAGQSPPSQYYNSDGIGLPFFQGKADFGETHPTVRMWCSRPHKVAKPGDILISVRAPVGPTNLADRECCIGRGLAAIRSGKDVDTKYLLYYFRFIEPQLSQIGRGSTFAAITVTELRKLEIPLPPLPAQRRIAAILDAADALRAKRRAALGKLDALLGAVFLEMFGEPVGNEKGWPEAKLADLADIVSGVTKGQRFNGKPTVFVPYMRVTNVQDGRIVLTEVKTIEALASDVEKYQLQVGDILLTEGGDPDKLGRGAIWRGEIANCIHQNHIFRVRLTSDRVIPEFVSALISSQRGKRYFLRAAKQTTGIATINKTQLGGFPVLLPPIERQVQYRQTIEALERSRERYGVTMQRTEELFYSLQQRAFRGEL